MNYVLTPWMKSVKKLIEVGVCKKLLLVGAPGSSKTSFAEYLAAEEGYDLFEFNVTSGLFPEEVMFKNMVDGNSVKRVPSPIWNAFTNSVTRRTILVIDEIDKGKERVEELLLRGLETLTLRTFSEEVKANPENLVIIATSNNIRDLMKPTYRRFDLRIKTEFPSLETQIEIISSCLAATEMQNRQKFCKILAEAGEELRKEIGVEDAPSYAELGKIGDIVYAMSSMDNDVIADIIRGSLDKGWYDRPSPVKLSFNLVKALKTCL